MRFDDAPMQHSSVTNRDVVPQNQGTLVPHRVTDAAVLEVRILSDPNDVAVTADDAVEPEARIIADLDVTYDLRALCNKHPLANFRSFSLVLVQHLDPG